MKLVLTTLAIVTAIGILTICALEAVGANVFGPECTAYEEIGKACY